MTVCTVSREMIFVVQRSLEVNVRWAMKLCSCGVIWVACAPFSLSFQGIYHQEVCLVVIGT